MKINLDSPWLGSKTISGFTADEVPSMLQKAIRRGLEEDAINAAYEMYRTSPELEDIMWRRLIMVAMEDIGFGDLKAAPIAYAYYKAKDLYDRESADRQLPFVQIIRYLCRCPKERSSSYYQNMQEFKFDNGYQFEIADYALDKHTARGREMGRDTMYFYTDGDKVVPEHDDEENLHTKELKAQVMEELSKKLKNMK